MLASALNETVSSVPTLMRTPNSVSLNRSTANAVSTSAAISWALISVTMLSRFSVPLTFARSTTTFFVTEFSVTLMVNFSVPVSPATASSRAVEVVAPKNTTEFDLRGNTTLEDWVSSLRP